MPAEPTPEDHLRKLSWMADEDSSCGVVSAASRAAVAWVLGRNAELKAEVARLRGVIAANTAALDSVPMLAQRVKDLAAERDRLLIELASVRRAAGLDTD